MGDSAILSRLDEFYSGILRETAIFLPRLALSLLMLVGFLIASNIVQKIILRVHKLRENEIVPLLAKTAKAAVVVVGTVMALGTLGIDVSALVAGLGLTGFALGFAFKDALSNLLAGVMILFYRPFYRGDKVSIPGYEGIVTDINLRYTVLQNSDRRILVPNSSLISKEVSVFEKPR